MTPIILTEEGKELCLKIVEKAKKNPEYKKQLEKLDQVLNELELSKEN